MNRKRIVLLVAAVCLLALGTVAVTWAANTEPTIVFDVATKEFHFLNCEEYSYGDENGDGVFEMYPDLFPSIRNAMPGDSFSQAIRVKVINIGADVVKMSLLAENPNDDYAKLLYHAADDAENNYPATLRVSFPALNTGNRVFQTIKERVVGGRRLSYTEPLGTPVYLGAFSNLSREREINVNFDIPIQAGNELQGLCATIDWVFVAEIMPRKPTSGSTQGGSVEESNRTWNIPIEKDYHMAYIIGKPDGLIHPDDSMTRAEAATLFFRLMTEETREHYWETSNSFIDIPSNKWYNNAISTMANAGVIHGYPDGSFRPDAYITRAEFVTMVSRIVTAKQITKSTFTDAQNHWAAAAIDNASSLGIISGFPDGSFRPDTYISRAQGAAICNRLLNRIPHHAGLLEDMVVWPDNMDPEKWYYLDIQEATSSHLHDMRSVEDLGEDREYWIQLDDLIDWKSYERPVPGKNVFRSDD